MHSTDKFLAYACSYNHVSKLLASVKCGYVSHGEKMAVHFKLALPCKEHRLLINSYTLSCPLIV